MNGEQRGCGHEEAMRCEAEEMGARSCKTKKGPAQMSRRASTLASSIAFGREEVDSFCPAFDDLESALALALRLVLSLSLLPVSQVARLSADDERSSRWIALFSLVSTSVARCCFARVRVPLLMLRCGRAVRLRVKSRVRAQSQTAESLLSSTGSADL